jgi:hypothetical protein
MSGFKVLSRAATLSAVVGCVSLIAVSASAQTPEPPGLFSGLPSTANAPEVKPPKEAIAGKSRAVNINHRQLSRGRFFVSLPGGISFEAVREERQAHGQGRGAWVGHASDDPDSTVVIGISGKAVAGSFAYHGKLFKLEPRADVSHVLSEVAATEPFPELEPLSVADTISSLSVSPESGSVSADSNGPVIVVLVAYTPTVQAHYGVAGAEALILQAVAETNQAYANSGMVTRLNLVHSVLTNYTPSGDMQTDLARLKATNDGYMDELHALRDSYGADLVSLIQDNGQYCGYGYFAVANTNQGYPSYAFSVVHHSCATGYYSFAHELGHNQGANHDTANAVSGGAVLPYAYGYQEATNYFRTVMAYDCPGGCPRRANFSNSDILISGVPAGYAGVTENAKAIDETAPIVASFRQQSAQTTPSPPAALHGAASGASKIALSWTDTSANETNFLLERSDDGLNFKQIASLPADTSAYTDNNLAPDTLYNYRARAANSLGYSDYGNVAVAATQARLQTIDQLVSSEWGRGKVSGTFQDTWSKDGVSESLTEVSSGGKRSNRYSSLEQYWELTVQPGESVTLHADVSTTATQSFTFAYSTVPDSLAQNKPAWIDMFSVTASNSGSKQFTLPAFLSGPVYISVRDDTRIVGVTSTDSVDIDYLLIRTDIGTVELPPGC